MFENVVNLYRAASRPTLEDGVFGFEGPVTPHLKAALAAADGLSQQFGRFRSGPDYENSNVEFSWACGSNEYGRFYANLNALLEESISLSRGVAPANCYLVEEDHFVGENTAFEGISKLIILCELICLLEKLSLVPDERTNSNQPKSLIFVVPAGDGQPPKTLQMTTLITPACLSFPPPRIDVLQKVAAVEQGSSIHWQEHRSLFRLAIADVLQKSPSNKMRFSYLVEHWSDVLQKYQYDVDCLINDFSFDKVRRELAKTSLEFSAKFTSILGDNTGKFLALPVPILAVAGIVNARTLIESAIFLISTLAVAIVFSGTTKNQFIQLRQLEIGFSNTFEKLLKPGAATAEPIKTQIDTVQRLFNVQRRLLKNTLWFLRIGAWLPAIGGLAVIAYRFNPAIRSWILMYLP